MYNAPWKKATRLRSIVDSLIDLDRWCDRSHKHVVLRGKVSGSSQCYTALASACPRDWAAACANAVTKWAVRKTAQEVIALATDSVELSHALGMTQFNMGYHDPSDLRLGGTQVAEYHHIDDNLIIGGCLSKPALAAEQLVSRLKHMGFAVHDIEANDDIDKFIGYHINRYSGHICPVPRRLGILWSLLGRVVSWQYISPKFVEVLAGHWLWLAQLNRSCICIPFSAYHFINKHERSYELFLMWPGLRTELRCMRGALAFCQLGLVRDVVPCIGAADASGFDVIGKKRQSRIWLCIPLRRKRRSYVS